MRRLILVIAAFAALFGFSTASAHAAWIDNQATAIYVDGQQSHDAFAAWSKNTNVTLIPAEVCSGVNCIHLETVDTTPCDSGFEMGTVVAGCTVSNADGSHTCMVKNFDSTFGYAFVLAATEHELGHGLGLSHNTTDPHSIMQPVLDPSNPPRGPDHNDRAAVQALYP